MSQLWNILVIDDEEDVHLVTKLALKHKLWAKRGFRLTSAFTASEGKARLAKPGANFHVALVDVVMESSHAGLELCKHIRETCEPSMRIILRTGQAGSAPEDIVLNEYDIDYYLSKAEVTEQKLFSVVRACLRSSQDISTLLAFGKQIQSFTRALQSVSSLRDLLLLMGEGLKFLELKFTAKTLFAFDLKSEPHGDASLMDANLENIRKGLAAAHAKRGNVVEVLGGSLEMASGAEYGLPKHSFIVPFVVDAAESRIQGGLYVEISPEHVTDHQIASFRQNAILFLENWKIAYSTLLLQERVTRDRLLKEQMYFERMQSIANMVTGVAHEINTPLGVAATANSMIGNIVKRIQDTDPKSEDGLELMSDLNEACGLMTKNIQRAHKLIESFKKLSAGQLSDQRVVLNLGELVADCLVTMLPVTRKGGLSIAVAAPKGSLMQWDGYPGHLSQVIINFIQNTLRYGYPESQGGKVDIRLIEVPGKDATEVASYRIEFEDYGKGVAPEIMAKLFQPFVTSGRNQGGTGLGLAISQNIVTNLLKGKISCESEVGKGTKFTIDLPLKVIDSPEAN